MARRQSDTAREGRNLRRRLERRKRSLEKQLQTEKLTTIAEQNIKNSIARITQAQEATKFRTATGARRTEAEIKQGIEAAKTVSTRYRVYLDTNRRSFNVTESEINKASAGAPSIYTKEQTQIFYKMTQKAWQREGVSLHERNEAILEYYGRANLAQFVDEILELNKELQEWQQNNPALDMTEEDEERNAREQQADTEDGEKGSPTYLASVMAYESALMFLREPERL